MLIQNVPIALSERLIDQDAGKCFGFGHGRERGAGERRSEDRRYVSEIRSRSEDRRYVEVPWRAALHSKNSKTHACKKRKDGAPAATAGKKKGDSFRILGLDSSCDDASLTDDTEFSPVINPINRFQIMPLFVGCLQHYR
jgi:hypothetical protein